MITRREVDEFVLEVMQRAFLNLRECGGRADQTTLCELQQAMQLLPDRITSETPLTTAQHFFSAWPREVKSALDEMWRRLEQLDEGQLQLLASGGQLLSFAVAQEVEMRRIKRRDAEAARVKQLAEEPWQPSPNNRLLTD